MTPLYTSSIIRVNEDGKKWLYYPLLQCEIPLLATGSVHTWSALKRLTYPAYDSYMVDMELRIYAHQNADNTHKIYAVTQEQYEEACAKFVEYAKEEMDLVFAF